MKSEYQEKFKNLIVAVLDWQIAVENAEEDLWRRPFALRYKTRERLRRKEERIEERVEELGREIQNLRANS